MKIGILVYYLEPQSGESREAINLAIGLKRRRFDTSIYALACEFSVRQRLQTLGIHVVSRAEQLNSISKLKLMRYDPSLAAKLSQIVATEPPCDAYIVTQDAALPIIRKRESGQWIFLCNGDMSLLLLSRQFRKRAPVVGWSLSRSLVNQLESHARLAREYDVLLANSRFTRGLMSYLYDTSFDGVVYPPVDTDAFTPRQTVPAGQEYVFAVLRRTEEPAFPFVTRLARRVPVVVVGGATVQSADNRGKVGEDEIVRLYSAARLTVSFSHQEFFGYSIAESLACGTPVLALSQGGAPELITSGVDGWLEDNPTKLIERAEKVIRDGTPDAVRAQCRTESLRFAIDESTGNLAQFLVKSTGASK